LCITVDKWRPFDDSFTGIQGAVRAGCNRTAS